MDDHEIARRLYAEGIGSRGRTESDYVLDMALVVDLLFWRHYKVAPVLEFYEQLAEKHGRTHAETYGWLQRIDLQRLASRAHQLKLRSFVRLMLIDLALAALPALFLLAILLPSWFPNPEAASSARDSTILIGLALFAVVVQGARLVRDLFVVVMCLLHRPDR